MWALELRRRGPKNRPTLTAVFVSQSEELADNPDNITVSPRGGLVLCEDGGGLVVDGTRRSEPACSGSIVAAGRSSWPRTTW